MCWRLPGWDDDTVIVASRSGFLDHQTAGQGPALVSPLHCVDTCGLFVRFEWCQPNKERCSRRETGEGWVKCGVSASGGPPRCGITSADTRLRNEQERGSQSQSMSISWLLYCRQVPTVYLDRHCRREQFLPLQLNEREMPNRKANATIARAGHQVARLEPRGDSTQTHSSPLFSTSIAVSL